MQRGGRRADQDVVEDLQAKRGLGVDDFIEHPVNGRHRIMSVALARRERPRHALWRIEALL